MNFLKTVFPGTGSSVQSENLNTGAETIERIVDRVNNSTLLEDRRDATRALRSLSKKFRLESGAQGLLALQKVLKMDRSDELIIHYALDTLSNIMSPDQFEEEAEISHDTAHIGEQFTEMFIKNTENISLVLSYLEEYDFRVRWSAIKLLLCLLSNRQKEIQEVVLTSPMGVSRLMDLLIDTREIIRNDALLLLIQLTKGNANIQKIVAFENAFDKLFDVIREEGYSDGGIVVEDCLILMLNLLKNNSSNQQFFSEGSFIQKLIPMFFLAPEVEELGMTPQKVSNLFNLLQIVRILVSPNNSQQIISSCQKIMRKCGLLEKLGNMLMASGIPPDILTETINTVGEIIRGDTNSQEYFNDVMAPSNPPRPVLTVLLMSMVNEKQPLMIRCAVLYCFQCYLFKNEKGQNNLIQTLLPSSREMVSSLTTGQLLCGGLFSLDPLSNWFSAVALSHALIDNATQKENMLRSLLATASGNQSMPVSLMQQCINLLQQGHYNLQSRIGLLMLLCVWLSHSQKSVTAFLSIEGTISYLMAQVTTNEHDENENLIQGLCAFLMGLCIQFNDNSVENHTSNDLMQILIKRIGVETFTKKLNEVPKHEYYSKAAKQPQIRIKAASDLLLDYEFCKLFKSLESVIIKNIQNYTSGNENLTELSLSQEASTLVGQYKNIIRDQDTRIQSLQQKQNELESENIQLKAQLFEIQTANSQLTDQNIVLRAQLSANSLNDSNLSTQTESQDYINKLKEYEFTINTLQQQIQNLKHESTKTSFYESENIRLLKELEGARMNGDGNKNNDSSEIAKLKKDQEDLLELLTDQDIKINSYKRQLRELGQQIESDDE